MATGSPSSAPEAHATASIGVPRIGAWPRSHDASAAPPHDLRDARSATCAALGWASRAGRRGAPAQRRGPDRRGRAARSTGILGFEDTVIPQLENALLAGHDVILLGERGQAKTR